MRRGSYETIRIIGLLLAPLACTGLIGDSDETAAGDLGIDADTTRASLVCDRGDLRASPAPARHLTRVELDNTLRDVLGTRTSYAGMVPEDDVGDGYNVGATISQLHIESYLSVAEAAAAELMPNVAKLWDCADAGPTCARAFITRFGKRVFRRTLTGEEVDGLASFFAAQRTAYGDAEAKRMMVTRLLVSPDFLYRSETGALEAVSDGPADSVPLTPYELASRLSYLIWASSPDEALTAAAESGQLATSDGVALQARRMLGDAKARGGLRNFYSQWLDLHREDGIQKDAALYPQVDDTMRAAMNAEAYAFMDDVLWNDDGTLTSVLTSPRGFVDAGLAHLYGADDAYEAARVLPIASASSRDIGDVEHPGSTAIAGERITVTSAGSDIFGSADAFRFASFEIKGDGGVEAQVLGITGGHEWGKAGIMLRDGTDADDANIALHLTPGHGIVLNRRLSKGGSTESTVIGPATAPVYLAVERRADTVIASTSSNGIGWTEAGRFTVALHHTVQVGLAVARGSATTDLVASYEHVRRHGLVKVELDAAQRSGILTQAGLLARLARPYETSPIFRGVFLLDRFLCTPLAPPPDLNVNLPAIDPTKTTRERIGAITEKGTCPACHAVINPIGYAFEHYDAIGAWRDDESGKPIDASGALQTDRGRTAVDGMVGTGGIISALVDDVQLHECVATQWFRYAFGRANVGADDCSLAEVDRHFASSGYDLTELVVALTTTPAFRFRPSLEGAAQ